MAKAADFENGDDEDGKSASEEFRAALDSYVAKQFDRLEMI